MSLYPDLRPKFNAQSNLGKLTHRWHTVFAVNLSDGVTTVPVADIATKANVAAASTMPAVTSLDNGKFLGVADGRWQKVPAPAGVLPVVSAADNDKYLTVYNGVWRAMNVLLLPAVTQADNGKVLRVAGGIWEKFAAPPTLPSVTDQDEGKILTVINGTWRPALPPSDVLPAVTLADHGSLLTVTHGVWRKNKLEQATAFSEGLVPRLPGSPGRVLAGNNTWAAAPSGASGQWRLGDIRMTARATLDYGWLRADGTDILFEDRYKALYMARGGDEAGWAAHTPIQLPNMPDCCVRYLPDSQAPAEFGLLLDVDGTDDAAARLHFELALYREPTPHSPVVTLDTFYKATPSITFTTPAGSFDSSAPGWFWYDRTYDMWRLFSAAGERATPAAKAQVLVDLAEVPPAALQHDRMTPGSYYYRYRQVVVKGDVRTPGVWRWGRVLSTGGMSDASTQLIKLCDIFARGAPQWWTLPRSAARLFLVSSRGMVEEGAGLSTGDNYRILVDDGSVRGTRLAVLGQGYQQRNANAINALDVFSVVPQYTGTAVRTGEIGFTEMSFSKPVLSSWHRTLAFNRTTGLAANPDCVLAVASSGSYYDHAIIDMETFASEFEKMFGDAGAWDQALGMGFLDGDKYDYVVPPVNSLVPRRIRLTGGVAAPAITATGVYAWSTPYFLHSFHVGGHDYYIPGEAPGIWDGQNNIMIPFPTGTTFKGSRAAAIGGDGCIYCMPRYTWSNTTTTNSTGILRFDPITKEIGFIALPWTLMAEKQEGWHKAIMLRDGRVLFVPYNDTNFVILDPARATLAVSNFGAVIPGGPKWLNAWAMADGTVCGFGADAAGYGTLCFRFNPDTDRVTLFSFPAFISANVRNGVVMPDGNVLLFPGGVGTSGKMYLATAGDMPYRPCTASPVVNAP